MVLDKDSTLSQLSNTIKGIKIKDALAQISQIKEALKQKLEW